MGVRIAVAAGSVTLLLWAGTVGAQGAIYTCKDANGKTITSDRPLPECQGRDGRVLSKQGTTVKTIEGALTAEQKAARDAEEAKRTEEATLRAAQLRKDTALLGTYQNIDDLESKRQRAVQSHHRSRPMTSQVFWPVEERRLIFHSRDTQLT